MSHFTYVPATLTLVVLFGILSPTASGQSYYATAYAPYVGYGSGGYYGSHSSTVAEGYLRGYAELLQARGVASLYYAQALREREAARAHYLENRMLYLQMRADQREALAARREERREEARRRDAERRQIVAERQAADSVAIDWPAELRNERYEPHREEIESLARVRMDLGPDAGQATELAVRHAIRELAKQVMADEDAGHISRQQSLVVRPFVRGLAADILRDAAEQGPTTLTAANLRPATH